MNRIMADGFLVRKVDGRRDGDVLLTFFTETHGVITAIAYQATRSRKRFSVLEPFHTLRVELDEREEVAQLHNASILTPRMGYLSDLDRMMSASRALGWVRTALPARAPVPELWTLLSTFLDTGVSCPKEALPDELAAFGLHTLRTLAWLPPPSSVRQGMSAEQVLRVVEATIESRGS